MIFGNDLSILIYLIPVLLVSLTFHEFGHAYVSYRLGDPTAKNLGRLSLNPLKHLELWGSLMLLLTGFGWAKPVPINPGYYKDQKKGTMLVSIAGPLSNVLLAFIFAFPLDYMSITRNTSMLYYLFYFFYKINVGLAVFNLLPIPPLDGSKIFSGILPTRIYFKIMEYERFSYIIIILIFLIPGALNTILSPFIWVIKTAIQSIVQPIINLLV